MASMTIRDRIMAVYRGEEPDQIPVSIYARYLPRGSAERQVREMGVGIVDYYPLTTLLAPPWHTNPGFLSQVRGADFEIRFSWHDGRQVETRIYRTPVGTISQRTRQDPTYGSDWIEKFYISSLDDYKTMQYLVENTVFLPNEDAFLTRQRDLGSDGVVLGRVDRCPFQKLLIELAGPERFLIDLVTDPDPVQELIEVMDAKMDEMFEFVCQSQAEVVWQPDNISCDMTSPSLFQKYCLPYYLKHGSKLHEGDKVYLVHMDGRLKAIRELVAQSPIDCIESFSFPEIGGDLSFPDALAAWPDKTILPNFPSPLAGESEETIADFVNRTLEEAGACRTFMIQISEDIPPGSWRRLLPILCQRLSGKANSS